MRSAIVGCALLALGGLAIAFGVLPGSEAAQLWSRVWPVLAFVVAIAVVADLAAKAGLFQFLAEVAGRAGLRRGWLLWLLVAALATVSTIFLSLDTTALLLTPVVIVLARHVGMSPVPFAVTTVWLANTASLLLPVSNLTNLLAVQTPDGPSPAGFAALTWAPAIVGIVIPIAAAFLIFRRDLVVSYDAEPAEPVQDRPMFACAAVVVAALLPALVSGVPVWIPASVAALMLIAVFVVRNPGALAGRIIPWQLVILAAGLFLFMDALHAVGLGSLLAVVTGHGSDPLSLLRLSGVGAAGANVVNNLPAFLALEPTAGSPTRLVALLIGVNAGSLIAPWASLATLLWHRQLVAAGVEISWRRMALAGVVVAPITVIACTLALALAS